eukprot:NODE_29295_length_450_cov_2.272446.p2 GENE.NODE_29295_length_450_cov_2.272446~~NODE_29295_length_450_cov_2.272446.p2  ORF type:complete len:130 (-),score=23.96 NODE_29295_length_450_cov_2.272446:45-434(-)
MERQCMAREIFRTAAAVAGEECRAILLRRMEAPPAPHQDSLMCQPQASVPLREGGSGGGRGGANRAVGAGCLTVRLVTGMLLLLLLLPLPSHTSLDTGICGGAGSVPHTRAFCKPGRGTAGCDALPPGR